MSIPGFSKGCRALMAAAKAGTPKSSAASAPSVAKAAAAAKPKPGSPASKPLRSSSEPRKLARNSGILKPCPVSPALQQFLGVPEVSRSDAVKKIWEYIKLHNLQNPTDKREIYCDDKLKTLFEGKDKVGFLEIGKLLSLHFVKT